MEKLKNKHDHKLTNVLKAVIFSIVMLAPFFAIMSKCIYVQANPNAKESWSGGQSITYYERQPKYVTNEINSINDLELGNIYHFNIENDTLDTYLIGGNFYSIKMNILNINDFDFGNYDLELTDYDLAFATTNYDLNIVLVITDNSFTLNIMSYINSSYFLQLYWNVPLTTYDFTLDCDFILNDYEDIVSQNINELIKSTTYNVYDYVEHTTTETSLDNVFYYAVEDLKNEKLFNWTEDTAIYSAINTMCTGLDVQGGVLPLLLTYWALMTAIYIVFDIVIVVFVKLTHFME